MPRFIFVSFAFLGWGFYELSGGAGFEPPKRPEPAVAAKAAAPAPLPERITAASLTAQPVLTRRTETAAPDRPAADPSLRRRAAAEQLADASGVLASTQTAFSGAPEAAPLQLASLDGGLAAITAAPAAAAVPDRPAPETHADRRTIRASRVNMRQGPGTNYPVIARLLGGDEVIVIEDSGTGWLHLRAPANGRVGWIAASLVSKKRP
ncbi:SH3 domain-containing protein [Leisingera thetidis]|uniref:SH3 domain-containing protein n=1 Tax=Leisingera thetidis TaxID=2930199 RepID=UPI0021F6DAC7|nr:SH3 domain-containing protein [Leisingera thetidis]